MSQKSKCTVETKGSTKGSKDSNGTSHSIVDGVLYCKCGERAALRVSRTDANPKRPFYACYLPRYHEFNCNFFRWVDEVEEEIAQDGRVNVLGNKKEDELQVHEDSGMRQELVQVREVMLKTSEEVIEELRLVREVMLKTNEILSEHVKLQKYYGIGMALVVILLLIVLIIVVIVK
ncbi:uncharacterized protein At4g04775-like [Lotus japonicus]|uniref:uncharacterized protein At4g04775-like n=1 Tax=Lotus japonicus TaxID=34305 RepID=UPI00258C7418|nr:uncharacterized protein At4g04775-like [Lotus japonicus]XP_057444872.1 uncharacterized protein At4g04775-like [Lotus japonicus]XP_057455380.1 uncharacterized protein At4g04775-like [Lotus japonicus]